VNEHPEGGACDPDAPCDDCAAAYALPDEERPVEIPPWCDSPLCPCKGPLLLRAEHPRGEEYADTDTLICIACGNGSAGTPEQIAKAERCREAWEAEQARREAHHG